jgi:DNA replication and repair protein RecF
LQAVPQLQELSLYQFKNYAGARFPFTRRVVAFCGPNGVGKTNLLDAIHYLCFTRSYFSRSDTQVVQAGREGMRLEGLWEMNERAERVTAIIRETGKKEFALNGEPYEKFSKHLGRYPCVVIAPDDAALVTGDSRERRIFLDTLLSQLDPAYLQHLIRFKKALEQRNAWLKAAAETGTADLTLLEVLDNQLQPAGESLYVHRRDFLTHYIPRVLEWYRRIARKTEPLEMMYETDGLPWILAAQRERDRQALRTTRGPHRDDLVFRLGEGLFRQIASQGQRKSLLFALKLAEMDVLREARGFAPLLLLDDVFEKLDEERISNLLEHVCVENQGQVFITDTHAARLDEHLRAHGVDYQLIMLTGEGE